MWGVISAMGAITSVGRDAVTSCASIRAGISRPRPMIELSSIDEETQDAVPLIAHPICGYAEGFVGFGAWLRLATAALADLFAGLGRLPQGFWRDGCFLLLTRYLEPEQAKRGRNLVAKRLAAEYHVELPDERIEIVPLGGASLPVALVDAPEVRWTDKIGKILVVAVDSYFESEVISSPSRIDCEPRTTRWEWPPDRRQWRSCSRREERRGDEGRSRWQPCPRYRQMSSRTTAIPEGKTRGWVWPDVSAKRWTRAA